MKLSRVAFGLAVVTVIAVVWLGLAQAQQGGAQMTSIVGSYILVSRDLPDGTVLKPPDVIGMQTFTEKYRNFNVGWKTPDGIHHSLSLVSEYKLTKDTYKEDIIFWHANRLMDTTMSYDIPKESGQPVKLTVKDGSISWHSPYEPPVVTYHGDAFTAVAEGLFTDHWARVK